MAMNFGANSFLVYLAQPKNPMLEELARAVAAPLGLELGNERTGFGDLAPELMSTAR